MDKSANPKSLTPAITLSTSEHRVIDALRHGPIKGSRALAELTVRRFLSDSEPDQQILEAVMQATALLMERGLIDVRIGMEGRLEYQLSPTMASCAPLPKANRRQRTSEAPRAIVYAVGLGLATTVAGCAYLQKRPAAEQYVPQPLPTAQMVQERANDTGQTVWVLCEGASCPQVTPKTRYSPPQAAELPVALKVDRELRTLHHAVFFRLNHADLGPRGKAALQRVLPQAKAASRIQIVGRTDEAGSVGLNLRLARQRAQTIKAALQAAGVTAPIELSSEITPNPVLPQLEDSNGVPTDSRARSRRADIELDVAKSRVQGTPGKEH